MSPRSSPVTQARIAALANCSQNTVALALQGSTRISAKRRAQIERLAAKLGYRPSMAASGLRRGRSGLIGLYGRLDIIRTLLATELMVRLHGPSQKPILGLELEGVRPWHTGAWVDTLLALRVEAVVSFAWNDEPTVPPWASRTPVIFTGYDPDPRSVCDFVAMDRAGAVRMGVDYLVSQGHRRIQMLRYYPGKRIADAFEQAVRSHGLEPSIFPYKPGEDHEAILSRFLDQFRTADAPTAVFVLPTGFACELHAAAIRRAVRVPGDLTILAYDLTPALDSLRIPITTLDQPVVELAENAAAAVARRLQTPGAPPMHVTLGFRLNVRQ
jgi:DNA-binding LacI/PurR family transcriptional regulator